MPIAAKPSSYTVNTGHTHCPDHLYMMDEGAGPTLTDQGKTGGLNLTITGADWSTDGTHGPVLDFVAANTDYAETSSVSGLTGTQTIGVVAYGSAGSATRTLVSLCNSADFDQYVLMAMLADENFEVSSRYNNTQQNNNAGIDLPQGVWSFAAIRFSDSTVDWSLDGTAWDTLAVSHTGLLAAIDRLTIGYRNTTSPGSPYDDPMCAAMWWKASKSDAEVASIAADPWQFLDTSIGHPARSRSRGIPGMNTIASPFGRGW